MRIKTLKEANDIIDKITKEVEYLTSENKQIDSLLNEIEKLKAYQEGLLGFISDYEIKLGVAISLLDEKNTKKYNRIVYKDKTIDTLTNDVIELKESIDFSTIRECAANNYPNLDEDLAKKISKLNKIYAEELEENEDNFKNFKAKIPIKRIDEIKQIIEDIK